MLTSREQTIIDLALLTFAWDLARNEVDDGFLSDRGVDPDYIRQSFTDFAGEIERVFGGEAGDHIQAWWERTVRLEAAERAIDDDDDDDDASPFGTPWEPTFDK